MNSLLEKRAKIKTDGKSKKKKPAGKKPGVRKMFNLKLPKKLISQENFQNYAIFTINPERVKERAQKIRQQAKQITEKMSTKISSSLKYAIKYTGEKLKMICVLLTLGLLGIFKFIFTLLFVIVYNLLKGIFLIFTTLYKVSSNHCIIQHTSYLLPFLQIYHLSF
jgi:hypothetical protein